jgi:putative hydrolase of the HAD superfamily
MADCEADGQPGISGIKCIAFDAVGTLIFPDPPVAAVYASVGCRYGSRLLEPEIAVRFPIALEHADSDPPISEQGERDFWHRVIAEVLDDVIDLDACSDELFGYFERPDVWQCYDDVEQCLSNLRTSGYRIVIASNFDRRLRTVRQGMRELDAIHDLVISSEIGSRKPSPGFYDLLLQRAGCLPGELLMVGDHFENDVLAARRAGIGAVHLDRGKRTTVPLTISSLASLMELLGPGTSRGQE